MHTTALLPRLASVSPPRTRCASWRRQLALVEDLVSSGQLSCWLRTAWRDLDCAMHEFVVVEVAVQLVYLMIPRCFAVWQAVAAPHQLRDTWTE